jgi:hypothetical protein
MFICKITGQPSKHGEPLNRIVVATREKVYFEDYFNEDTREWEKIEIGRGWEIVKEVQASADGVEAWNSLTPEQQAKMAKSL